MRGSLGGPKYQFKFNPNRNDGIAPSHEGRNGIPVLRYGGPRGVSGHMAHPSQSHTAHYRLTADADDATCNVRPLKGQVQGTIPNITRRAGARLLAASSGQAGQLVHDCCKVDRQ